jgi:CRISPR-associated endonuclease Csn1
MKKILGLDLGTNSIGWALVEIDHENRIVRILGLGSRILQMDAGEISKFETGGKLSSKASQKTTDKTIRKLNERFLLRRDRIHCVLNLLKTLPEHYKVTIDFENEKGFRSGKFKRGLEEKLAYVSDENGKSQFLFMNAYKEMEAEFEVKQPDLFRTKNNGKRTQIPYDWTLYYLRKKALKSEITKEELAWITLSFNQKRGYEKTIGQDEKLRKEGEISEIRIGKVKSVIELESKEDLKLFQVILVDVDNDDKEIYCYKEESSYQITDKDELKEIEVVSKYDENGDINEKNTTYTIKEIREIEIIDVKFTDKKVKENFVFEVVLKTGWVKEQQSKFLPKWKDTKRDFIIKTNYDKNGDRIQKGTDKGRNINAPKEEDWTLLKLKTETTLSSFNTKNKTVGVASYIYNELLKNPNQKIKGDLITVIERKYYREELEKIFDCQKQFHNELENKELYQKAIHLLYPNNENHRKKLENYSYSDKILPFSKLITDDVILYQRDLKSKKSLITNCVYEKQNFSKIDKKTEKEYKEPLKAIHKANPLYQEFRIWQFIKRLKIIQLEGNLNNEVIINQDVSDTKLTKKVKITLFEYLNNRESVTQKQLFAHLKLSEGNFKWNYEKDHTEPCNETRYNFILRFKRIKGFDWKPFLTPENEYRIWHFFYSVKKQEEFKKGIDSLFQKLLKEINLSEEFKDDLVKNFITFGGYSNDYGTYSEKAIKKLLPFLRLSNELNQSNIEKYETRINEILKRVSSINDKKDIDSIVDDAVSKGAITSFWDFKDKTEFEGLALHQACYLVYNRYSEVGDLQYWKSPKDIETFLQNEFKQHSLNNPVVEKVLVETLQLVKNIWEDFGNGQSNFFDRIHIELGREMKKNTKERAKESQKNNENKKTKDRIIELLKELRKENDDIKVKSPFQQEKLRILEDDLLSSIEYDKDATIYTLKNSNVSISRKEIKEITSKEISKIKKSDFERYKLWLDQRYQSPYTGQLIKLTDLFNREKYEIEHIFPKERITLNSMINKVICETEVNKAKKASTGYQFIIDCKGMKHIKCAAHYNKEITILHPSDYEQLVKDTFTDKRKQEILLSKEIPDEFTSSQLNNTKYISKMAMKLLSNVVREEGEDSFRSKNVLPVTGIVTTKLKQDWQLNDTWNKLIQPRFQRLNEITNSNLFGSYDKINGHKVFINRVPEEISKDFDKKRIDHRHHAMDALVIALATESHVNYLNNISSKDSKDDKLEQRIKIKNKYTETRKNELEEKSRFFLPPAQFKNENNTVKYTYEFKDYNQALFKDVVLEALENTVTSFKQKTRIIRQRTNSFQKWNSEEGKIKTIQQKDLEKKKNFNVRQQLHKATYYGKVKLKRYTKDIPFKDSINNLENIFDFNLKTKITDLKEIQQLTNDEIIIKLEKKYPKVKVYEEYVASRFENHLESFASVKLDKILQTLESITDVSIQKILKKHLENYNYTDHKDEIVLNPELAFSTDGIKELNKNIIQLNNGKDHKPILKVRMSDVLGTKFAVSEDGQKSTKFVVTAQGSNTYCAFYEKEKSELPSDRKFDVPTLKDTIYNLKKGNNPCKEQIIDNKTLEIYKLLFVLSPNDLVYVPTKDEQANSNLIDFDNLNKEQISRIYKFTDGNSAGVMNFVPYYISKTLVDISKDDYKKTALKELIFEEKNESKKGISTKIKELVNEIGMGSTQSKNQNSLDGIPIKSVCLKINIDRLGKIKPFNK